LSASIDTSIPHRFLTAGSAQFVILGAILLATLGGYTSIHFIDWIDWENTRRGPALYYMSFLAIPTMIALLFLLVLQCRRSKTFAVTIDAAGIVDKRIVSDIIEWRDIASIRFKPSRSIGKSVGKLEISLIEDRKVSLQPPFGSRLGRLVFLGRVAASPIIIGSHGLKSGFKKLKEVVTAFAILHSHIKIVDHTPVDEEQT
jgi:hypothetical protein